MAVLARVKSTVVTLARLLSPWPLRHELSVFAFIALSCCLTSAAQDRSEFPVNDQHIVYHDVVLDPAGAISPWYNEDPSVAYDHNIRQVWKFWIHMRKCPNGVPYYLQHQVWKANEDDQRGLGGDQISMALDAWNLLYDYLGDPAVIENMVLIADYWLDHGMSSPGSLWSNLPFPYNTDTHSGKYDGDMRAGKGFLQPDKVGSFGAQLVMLYKLTGNPRYLSAAVAIADTLAARVTPGDETHSPLPFRVNAETGAVAEDLRNGRLFTAAYTSNWSPTLQLFWELQALHRGHPRNYHRAALLVSTWLIKYPIANNRWGPFFEDVNTYDYSDTEINADTMAAFILDHPDWDRTAQTEALKILQWSEQRLGNHDFEKLRVVPLNEQTVYLVPGNSHTSRHASVELMYCERTGDCERNAGAIRRLNWATYSVDGDGKNRYPTDDVWLTDGYGDYVRHYLRSMASLPDLAPRNQDHLLRTSSVIKHIEYGSDRIAYKKFDSQSAERFKLGASDPKAIEGGVMKWDESTRLLTVKATSSEVTVLTVPRRLPDPGRPATIPSK